FRISNMGGGCDKGKRGRGWEEEAKEEEVKPKKRPRPRRLKKVTPVMKKEV
uniref:Uncharacterized protein n=1 Tax=Amphimedon queenslandica TaxID=400682 RepID=A0A1X7VST3_AMPQE